MFSPVRGCTVALTIGSLATICSAQLAQLRQFPDYFGREHLPVETTAPQSMHLSDFDADGDLDLFVATAAGASLPFVAPRPDLLYLNDGSGIFSRASAGALPSGWRITMESAVGDVDGDGDLDIVGAGEAEPMLLLNDGAGRFADASTNIPAVGEYSQCLALGDIDGDGDLDLAIGLDRLVLGATQRTRLYVNDGTGNFSDVSSRLPSYDAESRALEFVDVDSDGDRDLVAFDQVLGLPSAFVSRVYVNSGSGTFTEQAGLPSTMRSVLDVDSGDVDADGDQDLVVSLASLGGTSRVVIYANDGSGVFTDVTAGRLPSAIGVANALQLDDLDLDGDLDLVTAESAEAGGPLPTNRFYLNDGSGRFTDVSGSRMPRDEVTSLALAIGDVDGDADPDLVFGNLGEVSQRDQLLLNDGTATFVDATERRRDRGVLFGDLDGDGDVDLVKHDGIELNDGTGAFSPAPPGTTPPFGVFGPLALEDVDADGDLDLITSTDVLINDGAANFATHPVGHGGRMYLPIAFADLDGDGDRDIVRGSLRAFPDQCGLAIACASHSVFEVFVNDGTGGFVPGYSQQSLWGFNGRALALGDLDSDGDVDVVLSAGRNLFLMSNSDIAFVFLNDGSGRFTNVSDARFSPPLDPAAFHGAPALADLDTDGDLDIVTSDRVFRNDGAAQFVEVTAAWIPPPPPSYGSWGSLPRLGDVDRDGDPDLVFERGVLLNDRGTRFVASDRIATFRGASDPRFDQFVDIDGDGDLDLYGDRPYINLHRHVQAPWIPRVGRRYAIRVHAEPGYATGPLLAVPYFSGVPNVPGIATPFGNLQLDPVTIVALAQLTIPAGTGQAQFEFTIPADPSLIGRPLTSQAIVRHSDGRFALTNVVSESVSSL